MIAAGMLLILASADPLVAQPATIDAGVIHTGQPFQRRFELVNAGSETITITQLQASCGCAAPTIDRRTVPPGERATVTIDVNTLSQPAGPVRWTIAADWRAGSRSGKLLWQLTAQLVREIDLQPAALVLSGGPGLSHEIVVTDRRPNALTIIGVRSESGNLKAELLPDRRVRVRMAEHCPAGSHVEHLLIATNDAKYPELRVPVTIHRQAATRFTAVPAKPVVTPSGSTLVQLRGPEGETVAIESWQCDQPAIAIRTAPGPGSFATMRISLDKSRWDGRPFTTEVRVRFASPKSNAVTIPVSVRAEE